MKIALVAMALVFTVIITAGLIASVTAEPPLDVLHKVECKKDKGIWLSEYNECEGMSSGVCNELGGTYDSCASQCRHDPYPTLCNDRCIAVCSF